jgi:hypothetical protein
MRRAIEGCRLRLGDAEVAVRHAWMIGEQVVVS